MRQTWLTLPSECKKMVWVKTKKRLVRRAGQELQHGAAYKATKVGTKSHPPERRTGWWFD